MGEETEQEHRWAPLWKGVSVGSVAIPARTSGRGAECAHVRRVNQRGMGVGVGIQVCVRERVHGSVRHQYEANARQSARAGESIRQV